MKSVAIMQPTYLPWVGYFNLLNSVDEFIFLDSVQFSKRSWQQRNKIKAVDGFRWLTVPVITKGKREQSICEVEIDGSRKFPSDHISSLMHSYGKSPFYDTYANELFKILGSDFKFLADLNIALICHFCKILGIRTNIVRSSEMDCQGNKSELLAHLCKQLNASIYISPPGSKEYMDQSTVFKENNIEVMYHEYLHPTYNQINGEFEPFMSIVDLLFNCGDLSLQIISSGAIKQ